MPITHATPIKDQIVYIEYRKPGVTAAIKSRIDNDIVYNNIMEVVELTDLTIKVRVNSWSAIEYLRIVVMRSEGVVLTNKDY